MSIPVHVFMQIGDDRLGKNAETVFRDKKTGKKRDLQSEKQADDAKQAEWKQKYDKWGAGYVCMPWLCNIATT